MSEVSIKRRDRVVSFAISSVVDSSSAIRMDDMAGGAILMPTVSTNVTRIVVYGATSEQASYFPLAKVDGGPAEITLSNQSTSTKIYCLPDEVFGVPFFKVVANNTAADGVQCTVVMKS